MRFWKLEEDFKDQEELRKEIDLALEGRRMPPARHIIKVQKERWKYPNGYRRDGGS